MKRVYSGHYRIVLRIGNLAFKFPHHLYFWGLIASLQCVFTGNFQKAKDKASQQIIYILLGILGNITEYLNWLYFGLPVLPRVYFSIGFVTVQKFVDGTEPTWQELEARFEKLPQKARERMEFSSKHYFSPYNYKQVGENIFLIDSGDLFLNGKLSLSSFLTTWCSSFSEVMCPGVTHE